MRIIPNQSEKRFVIRLMKMVKNQSDLIRLIPRHEFEPIRNQVFNPHQSEPGSTQTQFPIRINRNESKVGMIRIDSD